MDLCIIPLSRLYVPSEKEQCLYFVLSLISMSNTSLIDFLAVVSDQKAILT